MTTATSSRRSGRRTRGGRPSDPVSAYAEAVRAGAILVGRAVACQGALQPPQLALHFRKAKIDVCQSPILDALLDGGRGHHRGRGVEVGRQVLQAVGRPGERLQVAFAPGAARLPQQLGAVFQEERDDLLEQG